MADTLMMNRKCRGDRPLSDFFNYRNGINHAPSAPAFWKRRLLPQLAESSRCKPKISLRSARIESQKKLAGTGMDSCLFQNHFLYQFAAELLAHGFTID